MPDTRLDEVLLALRDAGLAPADHDAIDGACRSRLAAELGRGRRPALAARPRLAAVAVVAVVLALAAGTYAVPATRAAVDDVYSALSDWVSGGEGSAPGRPVGADEDVPSWVVAEDGDKRVLAEAAGEKLIAIRRGDKLSFALNNYGLSGTIQDLRGSIDGQKIMIVGPGDFVADGRHDRRPLFGILAPSVERIRFDYDDGGTPASQAGLDGAFALVIETNRRPRSLTGYDHEGRRILRVDLVAQGQDYRYCPGAPCEPWPR